MSLLASAVHTLLALALPLSGSDGPFSHKETPPRKGPAVFTLGKK